MTKSFLFVFVGGLLGAFASHSFKGDPFGLGANAELILTIIGAAIGYVLSIFGPKKN